MGVGFVLLASSHMDIPPSLRRSCGSVAAPSPPSSMHVVATHSQTRCLLLAPASVVRGVQQPHINNGRVLKLCTHAAAHVTALFNHKVQRLCAERHLSLEESCLASFDCRLG